MISLSLVRIDALFLTPIDVLVGVSIALLFGTVAATLVGVICFVAVSFAHRPIPPLAGGGTAAAITAVALYAAGVVDPGTVQPGLALGLGLVVVLGLYATSWGGRLAAELPRLSADRIERTRPLATAAVDSVDAMGQVTIRSSGGIREFEGYPPLEPGLRAAIEDGTWRFPADLPLSELESRLETTLRTTHDLEAVAVAVDGRGRATITAAPPANNVASDISAGWRAVSVCALLPTGLAPGDDVLVIADSTPISGRVLSATVDGLAAGGEPTLESAIDGFSTDDRSKTGNRGGIGDAVIGGEGCVTVAVPTTDAQALLQTDRTRIVVTPRGASGEFDAISVLERDEMAIRKGVLTEAMLDGITDDETDLTAFAVRRIDGGDGRGHGREWQFEPDQDALTVGAEAFVLGTDATAFGPAETGSTRPVLEVGH